MRSSRERLCNLYTLPDSYLKLPNTLNAMPDLLQQWIRPAFLTPAAILRLRRVFQASQPYPHLALQNLLLPRKLTAVRSAFLKQPFVRKESDLFSFLQTPRDLATAPQLRAFHALFTSRAFLEYIESITGVSGLTRADMSGFIYERGDHLLPHDDRLSGRRIAYVFNLSQRFSARDGGALTLFDTESGKPTKPAEHILPTDNMLVLFQVSPISFHQVDEVLTKKRRMTIAGWFHGGK